MRTLFLVFAALFFAAPISAEEDCANPLTSRGQAAIADGREKPCEVASEKVQPRLRASTPIEKQAVLRYFNAELKDAPSARWQWSGTWADGWICGKVNAKNSFGGYTGWQSFAYRDGRGFISEDGRNHWSEAKPAPCLLPSFISLEEYLRR